MKMVLVGGAGGTNVASGYLNACQALELPGRLVQYSELVQWPLFWRVWRKATGVSRPWLIPSATDVILGAGEPEGRNLLFVCGLWPLPAATRQAARARGWQTGIYLTDSPWNPSLPYAFGLDELSSYDRIFAPRRSDLEKLQQTGLNGCEYLPFSYDPAQFFPGRDARATDDVDVLFVGGGDRERLPIIEALLKRPYRTRIIGNYWPKLLAGHPAALGQQPHSVVREATAAAGINICLVRRANFDGHVMRSIEIGACGGCILAERTDEHLQILGPEGESAMYFSDNDELIRKVDALLADPALRLALGAALHRRISEAYTYEASLRTVLTSFAKP